MRAPNEIIYKLTGQDLIGHINSIALIPGILSVQSFGDSLHLTLPDNQAKEDIRGKIQNILGRSFQMEPVEPSLEDLFIALIEGKS